MVTPLRGELVGVAGKVHRRWGVAEVAHGQDAG